MGPAEPRPKRRYDNTLRLAQARATRAIVVDAALELFMERGYAATSMEGIAELAQVPIATLYRLVGSKAVLLADVLSDAVSAEPTFTPPPGATAAELLGAAARFAADLHVRNGHLYLVLRSAAPADEAATEALAETDARRLDTCTAVASALDALGALPEELTPALAVDVLHALLSADVHARLTRDRHWSTDRYEHWLAGSLRAQLLQPAAADPLH